jgi:23S rRNA pseudouridine2605 synthase
MERRSSPDQLAKDEVRVIPRHWRPKGSLAPSIVRLNRFLSQCGLGSRRGSEQIILEGRVAINGKEIKDLSTLVADGDQVTVDGRPARPETGVVIALNKPRGYICSRSDEKDRMTIYALLPKPFQTLHHVGRLDKDSEGLLLLTNRGDLSHHLIHPSHGAEKEYEVIVDKPMDAAVMAKLVKGMLTEEGYAKAERTWMISEYRCHVVLKQGMKRQIRLMFYQLGFEVERLTRTRIGWLELKGLQKGGWKQLTTTEVERFFSKEGTSGRPLRLDKARAAKAEDEAEDVVRPTRKTEVSPRPAREKRSYGKGGSSDQKSRRPTSTAPARERPPMIEPDPEEGNRPVWGKRRFARDQASGESVRARSFDSPRGPARKRPAVRETDGDEVVRPTREKRSFGKGKPAGGRSSGKPSGPARERPPIGESDGAESARPTRAKRSFGKGKPSNTRSFDKPRAPREDAPRRQSRPSGQGSGNSRPSSSSKRNGPQRRR